MAKQKKNHIRELDPAHLYDALYHGAGTKIVS